MKKFNAFLLGTALLFPTVSVLAVSLPFNVPTPEKKKAALGKATYFNLIFPPDSAQAEDVYFTSISRAPSFEAEIIAVNDSDMLALSLGNREVEFWTNDRDNEDFFYVPFSDGFIAEEKDGWLRIPGIGCQGSEDGWVTAENCIIREPVSFRDVEEPDEFEELLWLKGTDAEAYDYALYANWDNTYGIVTFMVGKLSDGMLVCPYQNSFYFDEDEDLEPGFYENEEGQVFYIYNPEKGNSLKEFEPKNIDMIVESCTEKEPYVLYLYEDGREFSGDYIIEISRM